MKQIFILGASSVYGVGAKNSGWGDLIKSYVHSKMYDDNGVGEKYEVFNFSKAGATVEFVEDAIKPIYNLFARNKDLLTLISVGGNDAKAEHSTENYVCSPDEFAIKIDRLINKLKKYSNHIVFVSNNPIDESKTNPKLSPFGDNKKSFFTNERRALFNIIIREVCERQGIKFVVTKIEQQIWINNYLYSDGLHPNQAGYYKIFESIKPLIDSYL